MIAAARRHIVQWSWRVDRVVNRELERAAPKLHEIGRRGAAAAAATVAWLGPRLRPLAAAFFRGLALAEAAVRRACRALAGAATAASAVLTPRRAAGGAIVAAGLLLVASQFVDYRGVQIGQPGYTGLPDVAAPPTVDVRTAGAAHAYLLVPVGLLVAVLGLLAARRSRPRLGLSVAGLGLLSVLLILLVDRPAGLDLGTQATRFSDASAVLDDGYYAELAAAGALVFCGLLYYARPCLIRISSSGRAASARRRRPRPPASSPARVARSA
ncbi:MAG TPA: hypothetical protein VMT37_10645 [Solirubrobacterales bacterium]|nr:hypothetical protein [Solirubrobacterales bacterium]